MEKGRWVHDRVEILGQVRVRFRLLLRGEVGWVFGSGGSNQSRGLDREG